MKKVLALVLLIISIFLVTSCNNNSHKYLDEINYNELVKLIENKETFILEIYQDGCSHCGVFNPRFKSVLEEYKVYAKALNITNLTEKEYNNFKNEFGTLGTPTVIFMVDGVEKTKINRLVGEASKKEIVRKLKQNGYIK